MHKLSSRQVADMLLVVRMRLVSGGRHASLRARAGSERPAAKTRNAVDSVVTDRPEDVAVAPPVAPRRLFVVIAAPLLIM
jgi:hypothetical protein